MTTVTSAGKLDNLGPRLENGLKRGLILSGKLVSQRATRKAPRDTGRLKRSIREGTPYQAGGGVWAVDVGTNVEYARALEYGSGLYAEQGPRQKIPIRAKNARVLAFEWQKGFMNFAPVTAVKRKRRHKLYGKYKYMGFFRQVMHPGVRPWPYLRPAVEETRDDVRKLILKNVVAAIKGK